MEKRRVEMDTRYALRREAHFTNLSRAKIYTIGLIIIHLVLLTLDINRLVSGKLAVHTGYRYLFYIHIVLTAGLSLFLLLFYLFRVKEASDIRSIHMAVLTLFYIFLLLIAAAVSSVDQLIHGEVTVYVIGLLALSVGAYLSFPLRLALFLPSFIVALVGVTLFQSDMDILTGNYINVSLVFVIAFILSQIMFQGFKRTFLSRITIQEQQEQLEKMSLEDSLTGLRNRRFIDLKLMEEWDRALRYGRDFSIAIADLDNFKKVNDSYGHNAGDSVLRTLGVLFRGSIRGVDTVARYGGEEFLLLFPETNKEQACAICEKVRKQTEAYPWSEIEPDLAITISFGIASIDEVDSVSLFVDCADKRLYHAKEQGRNRSYAGEDKDE